MKTKMDFKNPLSLKLSIHVNYANNVLVCILEMIVESIHLTATSQTNFINILI